MAELLWGFFIGVCTTMFFLVIILANDHYHDLDRYYSCMYSASEVTRESYEFCLNRSNMNEFVVTDAQMQTNGRKSAQ